MNKVLTLATLLTLLLIAAPLAAATYTVNSLADNTNDDAFCTLREAILAANNAPADTNCGAASTGDDTIVFGVSGTIPLASQLPDIATSASAGKLTIDGSGQSVAVSGESSYRVFLVPPGADLALNELTVENGSASTPGTGGCYCGGGLYNDGNVTVTRSTFVNNSATSGGGLYSWIDGTTKIINSTFFGNQASSSGGGLTDGSSTVAISYSTFTQNSAGVSGGGLAVFTSSTTVKASIIASNTGGDCYISFAPAFLAMGANLDDDGSCTGFSLSHVTPELDPNGLQNNGGPTDTVALLPSSIAVDAGADCTDLDGNTVTTDQRGVARPQGTACDLGAYEYQSTVAIPALSYTGLALLGLLLALGATTLLRRG